MYGIAKLRKSVVIFLKRHILLTRKGKLAVFSCNATSNADNLKIFDAHNNKDYV